MFPAYNEEKGLARLLPELNDFLKDKLAQYRILIIDDGSTDSTREMVRSLGSPIPLEIVSHEKNRGIGEVFRTGFEMLSNISGDDDIVIVLEADGTSDFRLIPKMIEELQRGNDIVIASRYQKGGSYRNFPLRRHALSLVGNMVLRSVFRKRAIRDYTIFYRAYKAAVIKKAMALYGENFITSKTFLANTEALLNLAELTDKIGEVPFVYSYNVKIGKSKMPIMKTLFDYLRFLAIRIL